LNVNITESHYQERKPGIWFAQQLDPENPIYNTAEYVEIKGPLDQELFEKALRHVMKEAESFHARFGEDQDGPWQVIVPSADFPIHYGCCQLRNRSGTGGEKLDEG
jgi:hypothetical protein